jgi:hypothetical protein
MDKTERAFPLNVEDKFWQEGMTLRDYFAGQALMGLIINDNTVNKHSPISARAYELADAMLAQRSK